MSRAPVGGAGTKALLCDADGNLFPSEEPAFQASTEVINAFLAHHGVEVTLEPEAMRRETTGRSFRTTIGDLDSRYGIGLSSADREYWVARERVAVTRRLTATLRPDPHVLEPLDRLARQFLLVAVSSSASERIRACLEVTDLVPFFPPERCFSAEDSMRHPSSKPDPAIYRFSCRRIAASPDETVAVEDSVPGVRAAVGAGIVTVGNLEFVPGAERGQRASDLLDAGAAAVVSSWVELEGLLRSWAVPNTGAR